MNHHVPQHDPSPVLEQGHARCWAGQIAVRCFDIMAGIESSHSTKEMLRCLHQDSAGPFVQLFLMSPSTISITTPRKFFFKSGIAIGFKSPGQIGQTLIIGYIRWRRWDGIGWRHALAFFNRVLRSEGTIHRQPTAVLYSIAPRFFHRTDMLLRSQRRF